MKIQNKSRIQIQSDYQEDDITYTQEISGIRLSSIQTPARKSYVPIEYDEPARNAHC
jgi:hypothetical protein